MNVRRRGSTLAARVTAALIVVGAICVWQLVPGAAGARVVFAGSNGKDTMRGNGKPNRISGGRSADRLYGRGGNDVITGGTGRDLVRAGVGADAVEGDEARDRLYGQGGDDRLGGGTAGDRIKGGIRQRPDGRRLGRRPAARRLR